MFYDKSVREIASCHACMIQSTVKSEKQCNTLLKNQHLFEKKIQYRSSKRTCREKKKLPRSIDFSICFEVLIMHTKDLGT